MPQNLIAIVNCSREMDLSGPSQSIGWVRLDWVKFFYVVGGLAPDSLSSPFSGGGEEARVV